MAYNYMGSQPGSNTYNYYNPTDDYGGGAQGWNPGTFQQTPLGNEYLENNREAAFTRYLADKGFRDYTALGEFGRSQFGKVSTGYEAALATNPELSFQNYMQSLGNSLSDQYRRLTPEQRGETPNRYATRARYIPR